MERRGFEVKTLLSVKKGFDYEVYLHLPMQL